MLFKDHLGSTRSVVKVDPVAGFPNWGESWVTVEVYDYNPYGDLYSSYVSDPDPTEQKFTGKERDGNGLDYFGARYYDGSAYNAAFRWISADSLTPHAYDPPSLNKYAYVRSDPVGLSIRMEGGHAGCEVARAAILAFLSGWSPCQRASTAAAVTWGDVRKETVAVLVGTTRYRIRVRSCSASSWADIGRYWTPTFSELRRGSLVRIPASWVSVSHPGLILRDFKYLPPSETSLVLRTNGGCPESHLIRSHWRPKACDDGTCWHL